MDLLAHLVIVVVMTIVSLPFLTPLLGVQEQAITGPVWLLVMISAVSNLLVMGYHYSVPPHPKFLLTGWRRLVLRVHILSGTVDLISGIIAIMIPGHRQAAIVMAISALCFHVPSALAQTPIVFGSRAIMRPGYLLCIGLHAFCASRLLIYPESTYWAVTTFLIFNVYVWCRLYYYVFDKFELFSGSRYTVAICAAGLTTIPAVLGSSSILLLIAGCSVYMGIYSMFFIRSPLDYQEFVRERARDASPIEGYMTLVDRQDDDASRNSARDFFQSLHLSEKRGVVADDLYQSLAKSGMAVDGLKSALETKFGGQTLHFQDFYEQIWSVREIRRHALVVAGAARAKSDRDKAEFVFGLLDLDRDGTLAQSDFELLTAEWAMPAAEATRLLTHLGVTQGGTMNFDRFFRELRPVWRFVFYDVVDAKHGRQEDMLVRAITARREAKATKAVREDLRHELISHINFLQGASREFLDEFAASLVETRWEPDQIVFSESDPGECLYIVRLGQLRVDRSGELLGHVSIGDWVGEGALLDDSVRSASLTTVTSCTLFEMSRASFQFLLRKHPKVAATLTNIHEERHLEAMHNSLKQGLLADIPILAKAKRAPLQAISEALNREVMEGEIFAQGDSGDRFYLIGAGHVRIVHDGIQIAELSAGGYFGEGALLAEVPRTASAIAVGKTTLYSLDRQGFQNVLAGFPALAEVINEVHRTRQLELGTTTDQGGV